MPTNPSDQVSPSSNTAPLPPRPPAPPSRPRSVPVQSEQAIAPAPVSSVVIQTMQDDLAGKSGILAAAQPAPVPVQASPSIPSSPNAPAPIPVATPSNARSKKIVLEPPKIKHPFMTSRILLIGLAVFGAILVIGGSLWGLGKAGKLSFSSSPTGVLVASQMLPKDAGFILGYSFATQQDRQLIASSWQNSGVSSDLTGLLQGNPSVLLNDADLKEVYVVLLDNQSRPFVIVPETSGVDRLIEGSDSKQVTKQNGWVVLHSISTDPYVQLLGQGTVADTPDAFLFTAQQQGSVKMLGQASFISNQLAENATNAPPLPVGSMRLAGQISEQAILLTGDSPTNEDKTQISTDFIPVEQRVLSSVPDDVIGARVSNSFNSLVSSLLNTSWVDASILSQPAVAQLAAYLNSDSVLYSRKSADNSRNFGFVVKIPASAQDKIRMGDPVLENGLQAIVPLLSGQPLTSHLTFADGNYQSVPLRYVNVAGTSASLDYALLDGQLLVATSKDGMLALIDTAKSIKPSVLTGSTWKNVISSWGSLPSSTDIVFGVVKSPALSQLLPHTGALSQLPIGIFVQNTKDGRKIKSSILIK